MIHMIVTYSNGKLIGTLDEDAIYETGKGMTPAFIIEAMRKCILYAVARGTENYSISSSDIVHALLEMKFQFDLMMKSDRKYAPPTLDRAMLDLVETTVRKEIEFLK